MKRLAIILALLGMSVGSAQASISYTDMQTITKFCRAAYIDYRKTGDPKMLTNTIDRLPAEGRPAVAMVCYAYAQGFMDGEKSVNSRKRIT